MSVNAWGLFVQPWYYSQSASTWYKLTFSSYPLDTAVGIGYGSSHWSGTTVSDLYSLTTTQSTTDYSNFVVDSSDTTKSVGHGKIVASRSFVLQGQPVIVQNTFSLGRNDSFVKIITRVINNSTETIQNMIIWTGTRDDYVGTTDVNTKTRGNLDTGSFVPITQNNQSSRAILITNTNEGVLFYSETPGVMTAFQSCCSFSNVYNVNPLMIGPSTPSPTDGSYAAVLPLGNISVGSSGSITWYYAAGVVSSLSAVAQTVAAAQVLDTQGPNITATPSSTTTISVSGTGTGTVTPTGTPTGTGTGTTTISVTGTGTVTSTGTGSTTLSLSNTPTGTGTPTDTTTASLSSTSTATVTQTGTGTPTSTVTSTSTITVTSTGTGTSTISVTPTGTGTSTISVTPTGTGTASSTATGSSTGTGSSTVSVTPTNSMTPMPTTAPLLGGSTTHVVNVELGSLLPDLIIANVVTLIILTILAGLAVVYYRLTRPPAERPIPLMLRDPAQENETVVTTVEERLPHSVE
jgi:hypothetical protein